MHRIQAPFHARFVVPLFVTALAGCGGSAQNLVPATTSVNPVSPSYAALQVPSEPPISMALRASISPKRSARPTVFRPFFTLRRP